MGRGTPVVAVKRIGGGGGVRRAAQAPLGHDVTILDWNGTSEDSLNLS